MAFGADDGQTACCLHFGGELDVGTTACHVGGDGHGSEHALLHVLVAVGVGDFHLAHSAASGFLHDVGLAHVLLGVEGVVWDMAHVEHLAQHFGYFNRCGTHEHRTACVAHLYDFFDDGLVFLARSLVDAVVEVLAGDGLVGGNLHHVELVDVPEFACLGAGRTGHTGEFVVHAEVVLQGDGGECLCGSLHVLLGFHGLVESVAPAASLHDTAGLLVHDFHFTVHHHVLVVDVEHGVGLEQLLQGVHAFALHGIVVEQVVFLVEALLFVEVFLVFESREFAGNVGEHEELLVVHLV